LELSDLFGGLVHDIKTVGKSFDLVVNSMCLCTQKLEVELNELQERGRSGVIVTSLLDAEKVVSFSNRHVHEGHVFCDLVLQLQAWDYGDFLEESLSDTDKGILGPLVEPINGGTINETGEHTGSYTESVTDG
jgi:hypothetical protein